VRDAVHGCVQVRANIQEELVIALYKEDEFGAMLQQDPDALKRRRDCLEVIKALEKAQRVLDELRALPAVPGALDSVSALTIR
jgi:GGDEF domain-containing protein